MTTRPSTPSVCQVVNFWQAEAVNFSRASALCEDVDCTSLDGPCGVGRCDGGSGACVLEPNPDGTLCDDGDDCTTGDACAAGLCRGLRPGDTCADTPLTIPEVQGQQLILGDTTCARDDFELSCGRHFEPRPEVIYRLVLTQRRTVGLRVESTPGSRIRSRRGPTRRGRRTTSRGAASVRARRTKSRGSS